MTGYGVGFAANDNVKYTVEIKSLNSKYLEVNLRLPKGLADRELAIRGLCSRAIERGKVNLTATAEHMDQTATAATINVPLFEKYFEQLTQLKTKTNAEDSTSIFELALQMPEVISQNDEEVDEAEGALLMQALNEALVQFDVFRADEGAVLKTELEQRAEGIMSLLIDIEKTDKDRIPLIREKMLKYMDQAVGKEKVDMSRFEQELVYYIDKLDITEEKVRLKSHCDYFQKTLKSTDANGKKLGFISQEMGREINTLGSKANDAVIQQKVIRMKEELEKIKEQLLNVL